MHRHVPSSLCIIDSRVNPYEVTMRMQAAMSGRGLLRMEGPSLNFVPGVRVLVLTAKH